MGDTEIGAALSRRWRRERPWSY